jgi:hypothetical protein
MAQPEQKVQLILPDNPLSVMTLFDADAKTLDTFIDYVCNGVEAGVEEPLKVLALSKKMEYITDRIVKRIKDSTQKAFELHGERANLFGTEMVYGATYTKYDFTACGDPQWNEATKIVTEREAFLKALKSPKTIVVDDSGEVVTVSPPRKVQTFGIKTTVK